MPHPLTRLWSVAVAALLLAAPAFGLTTEPATRPGPAAERVAFVVGNSAYQAVGALENPVNDASDIAIALEGLGFEVVLGTNLSHDDMMVRIERFGQMAQTSDVALFYYAGHGFQVDGTNYLVPVDAAIASPADVAAQTVAMGQVLSAMDRAPGLKLVVLDACRDNPFGAVLDAPDEGLARVGTDADYLFAYATQPDNVAYDGSGRNSFFTEAMLTHIYTPGQDVSELLINVRRDVLAATGGRQIPWDNSSLTRQFRFDASPPTASEETLLWQVAAGAQDPQLMQLYLQRYPEGQHSGDVTAFLQSPDGQTRALTPNAADTDAQAERLWTLARRTRMRPLLEFYQQQYPQGRHGDEVRRLLAAVPEAQDTLPGALCERLATHPRDATTATAGVPFEALQRNALSAIQSCSAASVQAPELPHYLALLARATAASGDLARAVDLYRRAADQGDLRAMVSLAQLYDNGSGVPADPAAARVLYEAAAEGGSHDAQINLAIGLLDAPSGPADADRAIALLRQASASGSAKAMFNLGVLAQDGRIDTPQAALDYFQRAARTGEPEAWRAAAILLDEGRGIPADPDAAAVMLLRGAAEDDGQINLMLRENGAEWSPQTLTGLQARLQKAGLYTSGIDGLPGPGLFAALDAWRNGGFDPQVLTP